jgi:hypothetical protein
MAAETVLPLTDKTRAKFDAAKKIVESNLGLRDNGMKIDSAMSIILTEWLESKGLSDSDLGLETDTAA